MNEPAVRPRPAATVMLVREDGRGPECYMLRRSAASVFLPEVFVFPGGAVDDGDAEVGASRLLRAPEASVGGREASDAAFEAAALREAFEEAGILLAARRDGSPARLAAETLRGARAALHAGTATFLELLESLHVVLDARGLWHFSHWITPPSEPRRFDTHFYLATAPPEQAASSDEIETHAGLWISPAEALRRASEGNFPLSFPTIAHLRKLAEHPTLAALRDFARTKPIRAVQPIASPGDPRRFHVPQDVGEAW
jgi:8-oxo-dGTP pyrophosphatase MutT (NUDIX family)